MSGPEPATYLALIGDIRGSRHLEDRRSAQGRLLAALDGANTTYGASMVAPLTVTGGDEFKALIVDGPDALRVAEHLEHVAYPIRLRFGLGRGAIETDLGRDVGALDGPAFHNARDAIVRAQEEDAWLCLAGFHGPVAVYEAAFHLIGRIRDRWTHRQWDYVQAIEKDGSQQAAAQATGVTKAAVSQALKAAQYQEVQRLLVAIREALWQGDAP